jgi:hypothetical protein
MVNAAGDYVASFIVARFVDGKDWLQKQLKKQPYHALSAAATIVAAAFPCLRQLESFPFQFYCLI